MKNTIIVLLLLVTKVALAANFGYDLESSWADTPAVRFECKEVKSRFGSPIQELSLNGKTIYRQPDAEFVEGGNTIDKGIFLYESPSICPEIIQNRFGYVVYEARLSSFGMSGEAPKEYVAGYYVINFNVTPPTVTELAQLDMSFSRLLKNNTFLIQ